MAKLGIFKRACMRALTWVLEEPEQSRTHPVNLLLYQRSQDGRGRTPFSHPQIKIGAHSYGLRRECYFPYSPADRVVIGKFCSLADGVKFVFGEHETRKVSTFPFKAVCFGDLPHADARSKGHIILGNDVWVGANVVILSGVEIGHGAVIGAGAVVTKNVPPYAIVGGVPARTIKHRLLDQQISALLKIQWWDWPLEKIRDNLDLFYGDPEAFIEKHLPKF